MINNLVPNNIACVITNGSIITTHVHPDEIQLLQNATDRRKTEFLQGRNCAHIAIKELKCHEHEAIVIGEHREPVWPQNVIGSITHCKGYCAAAVALKNNFIGIGIDAELNTKLEEKLIATTQTQNEIIKNQLLQKKNERICIHKIIFSAKESVFKFLHPLTQSYINFKDIEISVDFKTKSFYVTLLQTKLTTKVDSLTLIGKFDYDATHIVTCVYQFKKL